MEIYNTEKADTFAFSLTAVNEILKEKGYIKDISAIS